MALKTVQKQKFYSEFILRQPKPPAAPPARYGGLPENRKTDIKTAYAVREQKEFFYIIACNTRAKPVAVILP